MADSKITALTAISTVDPTADPLVIVDVSDTSMAASGTTKKSTINQLLGAGGTATLASATITGAATVGTTLGVTGVSTFAAGTALLPALTTTGDTNTGIYYPAADTFAVTTGGTERYRVDSSGNLGIGITPSAWAATFKPVQIGSGTVSSAFIGQTNSPVARIMTNSYFDGTNFVKVQNNTAGMYVLQNNQHEWHNAATGTGTFSFTQAMTLDASGNLIIGTTGTNWSTVAGFYYFAGSSLNITRDGNPSLLLNRLTSDGTIADFRRSGSAVGSISVTTTSTAYNTSSDYRLKESVAPLTGGLARVSALKPSVYKWKADGSNGEGFIAHELAEVVPAAVSGEKDAVNEDGSIKAQGVDLSKVVPVLVAAIQELAAEVNALKNA